MTCSSPIPWLREPAPQPSKYGACTQLQLLDSSIRRRDETTTPPARAPLCNNMRMNADTDGFTLNLDGEYVELAAEVFAMLADATRIRVILALRDSELSVNQLAEAVNKSQAAVSQHLAKLRLARIVTTRREGTRVFYRLANEHARQLVADAIFQAEHARDGIPAHHRHPHVTATPRTEHGLDVNA